MFKKFTLPFYILNSQAGLQSLDPYRFNQTSRYFWYLDCKSIQSRHSNCIHCPSVSSNTQDQLSSKISLNFLRSPCTSWICIYVANVQSSSSSFSLSELYSIMFRSDSYSLAEFSSMLFISEPPSYSIMLISGLPPSFSMLPLSQSRS